MFLFVSLSILNIDWRYQVWKSGVTITDNVSVHNSILYMTNVIIHVNIFNRSVYCAYNIHFIFMIATKRKIVWFFWNRWEQSSIWDRNLPNVEIFKYVQINTTVTQSPRKLAALGNAWCWKIYLSAEEFTSVHIHIVIFVL